MVLISTFSFFSLIQDAKQPNLFIKGGHIISTRLSCYSRARKILCSIKRRALILFVPSVLLGALVFGPAVDCACAASITSAQSGLWDDTDTWSTLTVPTANDDVTISGGHTVTNNDNSEHSVSNLTINANGILTHSDNSTGEVYKIWLTIGGDCVINKRRDQCELPGLRLWSRTGSLG